MKWPILWKEKMLAAALHIGEEANRHGVIAYLKACQWMREQQRRLLPFAKSCFDIFTVRTITTTPRFEPVAAQCSGYAWNDLCNSPHKRAMWEKGKTALAGRRGSLLLVRVL